ncbi:hypothetical protein VPH35_047888 [Triticum aestivum]
MVALLRFAARKVCSRATASLERSTQASFTATMSLAVVKELEQQRTLPWTILFHGRVSSLRWFSSSSESPAGRCVVVFPIVGTLLIMILAILATLLVCEEDYRASKKCGQTRQRPPSV